MNLTSIVLADDHQVVRQGLRALLEAEPGFQLVGEAGDGLEAVRLVDRLRPKVLIVDLMMPGLNGMEVIRQAARAFPQTRIIVLSMHADRAYVVQALKNGATGYVLKDAGATELIRAVLEVTAGRRYLSPPLSERDISDYLANAATSSLDPYETLTSRERQVLQLVAEGHTNPEIAARLSISPRTVEVHRAHLMHKLGLESQSDLIRFALRRGILPV